MSLTTSIGERVVCQSQVCADLGFSDSVYGLGVGMFYITYVAFERPGAVIVERWSARKSVAQC